MQIGKSPQVMNSQPALPPPSRPQTSPSCISLDPQLDDTILQSLKEYNDTQTDIMLKERNELIKRTKILEEEVNEMQKEINKKSNSISVVGEANKRDQDVVDNYTIEIGKIKEGIYSGKIYLENLEGKKLKLQQAKKDLEEEDRRVNADLYNDLDRLKNKKKELKEALDEIIEEKDDLLHKLQAKEEIHLQSEIHRMI